MSRHVAVRTPELRTVDLQLTLEHRVARELVDGQVEPRPQREPVDSREPEQR